MFSPMKMMKNVAILGCVSHFQTPEALKNRLSIVFRTNKQAAQAKQLWGKAVGVTWEVSVQ